SSSRRSAISRIMWCGSWSPTTARVSPPPSARSCFCRTTRRSGAAAGSVWRSCAGSSPSTAATSTSATTRRAGRGLQSGCHADRDILLRRGDQEQPAGVRVMKPTILIVDDEPGVRSSLGGVLRDEGYGVEAVSTGEACLERVTRGGVDLILLDVWLP